MSWWLGQCPPYALWQSLGCSGSQNCVFTRDPTHSLTHPLSRRLQWECLLLMLMPWVAASPFLWKHCLIFLCSPHARLRNQPFLQGTSSCLMLIMYWTLWWCWKSQPTLPWGCLQSSGRGDRQQKHQKTSTAGIVEMRAGENIET